MIKLALPYHEDRKAQSSELANASSVSLTILLKLLLPKRPVALWDSPQPACFVCVPEAAIHKDSPL
jgi:hypothetical protein